jgi:hypothetical protein
MQRLKDCEDTRWPKRLEGKIDGTNDSKSLSEMNLLRAASRKKCCTYLYLPEECIKRRKRTVRTGPVSFDLSSWVFTDGFGRGVRRNSFIRPSAYYGRFDALSFC